MAKRTKAQRSASARKGARTRKANTARRRKAGKKGAKSRKRKRR